MSRPGRGLVLDRAREMVLHKLVMHSGLTPSRVVALGALAIRSKAVTVAGNVRWPAGLTIILPREHEGRLGPVLYAERGTLAQQIASKAARGWPPGKIVVDVELDPAMTSPYELYAHPMLVGSGRAAEPDGGMSPTVPVPPATILLPPPTEPADTPWALLGPGGERLSVPAGGLELGRLMSGAAWLTDTQISRRHARVEDRPDGLFIRDLESSNGTRVDEELVGPGGTLTRPGQVLRIGRTLLTVAAD